jgi:uncharacterized Zn-binding protein involved in type VI secretion
MPAVTRIGDKDMIHCGTPTRAEGNTVNVYCNATHLGTGDLISCAGDHNDSHDMPGVPCPSHTAPITEGSRSVFINGDGVGRIGDFITGCTTVAEGSANVFAGPPIPGAA